MTSPKSPNSTSWEPPPGPEGAEARGPAVCPVCMTRVAEKAKKCPNCGEPLRKRAAAQRRRRGCQALMLALACCLGLFCFTLWRWSASVLERQAREAERRQERQQRMEWTAAGGITIGRNTVGCRRAEDLARPDRPGPPSCVKLPAGASARPEEYNAELGALRVRLAGSEEFWWMAAQRPAATDTRQTP